MHFSLIFTWLVAILLASPTPGGPGILSPSEGQALQGSVPVFVNALPEGFKSGELTFSYVKNPLDTWFFVADVKKMSNDGKIADWDTTTLTDGNYTLRLTITLQDGSQETFTVPNLRVRNYSPIETSTPTPPAPTQTSRPGDTPIPTATLPASPSPIPLTSTPLPPNPAQVTTGKLGASLIEGTLIAFATIAFFGLVLALRNRQKG